MAVARLTRWAMILIGLLASSTFTLWAMIISHPDAPASPVNRDQLAKWIDDVVSAQAATAISISVIQDGAVAWEMASGVENPFEEHKATPQTRYHIWSVTKLATALAVLSLAEDQKLDIDIPVTEILPWLDIDENLDNQMTTRDLLRHTSGLQDTVPAVFGWLKYNEDLTDQTEFLRQKMPDYRKLSFQPGNGRAYSNLGYMLLGAIIEATTGQAYEDVVYERVLGPAEMASSGFVFGPAETANEAVGSHPLVHFFTPFLLYFADLDDLVRQRDNRIWWFNRVYIEATPPTGLIASAGDAARLGAAAMAQGPVLQDATTVQLMSAPSSDNFPLGWFERDAASQWLQHRGGGPGYAAVLRVYPEQGLSIAVLASGTGAPVVDIAEVVAGIMGVEG